MLKLLTGVAFCLATASCGLLPRNFDPVLLPASIGEAESGYTYVPIDPFPVETRVGANCLFLPDDRIPRTPFLELLPSLPDNAVRMLVEQFDASGNVSYGVSKSGVKNESYRITVDYINADTINQRVAIRKFLDYKGERQQMPLSAPIPLHTPGTVSYQVEPLRSSSLFFYGSEDDLVTANGKPLDWKDPEIVNIPVYVGLGLRVSANVYVTGATANISGLGVIGAEAEADKLRGSLVVQTLGVNGKSVAAALPIQSELNRTTAQNAIAAVGTLKALLYADETVKSPRVVGMYLPFKGGKPLVNALISALSTARIEWPRQCKDPTQAQLADFERARTEFEAKLERERLEMPRAIATPAVK
jgi:hypothetical protein